MTPESVIQKAESLNETIERSFQLPELDLPSHEDLLTEYEDMLDVRGRSEVRAHILDLTDYLAREAAELEEEILRPLQRATRTWKALREQVGVRGVGSAAEPLQVPGEGDETIIVHPDRRGRSQPTWEEWAESQRRHCASLLGSLATGHRNLRVAILRFEVLRKVSDNRLLGHRRLVSSKMSLHADHLASQSPGFGELRAVAREHRVAEYLGGSKSVWPPLGPWIVDRIAWLLERSKDTHGPPPNQSEAANHVSECLSVEMDKLTENERGTGPTASTLDKAESLGLTAYPTYVAIFLRRQDKKSSDFNATRLNDLLSDTRLAPLVQTQLRGWPSGRARKKDS
jgi:hypothetical protein